MSDLVMSHGFIFLKRSLCMSAATLPQAIRCGRLCGPVVLTHSIAPRHTAYLAGLIADIEGTGRHLAFGTGGSGCTRRFGTPDATDGPAREEPTPGWIDILSISLRTTPANRLIQFLIHLSICVTTAARKFYAIFRDKRKSFELHFGKSAQENFVPPSFVSIYRSSHNIATFCIKLYPAMDDQLSNYRNYVKGIRSLLLFAGLWPSKRWDVFAYRCVPYVNAVTCFTMSCVVLNFCRDHSTNLDVLTRSIGIMTSYLSSVLKVICFLVNRAELLDLHRTLDKHFDEVLEYADLKIKIFDSLTIFVKPSFAITILLFIGTLVFILTPIIILIVQYTNDVQPLKFILPYPGKYPWSFVGGGFVYYVHYSVEILAGLYLFCVTSGVDSLFGYYVFQMQAVFRLMSFRMRNLSSNDTDYPGVIRDCVTKHRTLVKCRDQLQQIYGPIVLWMFLTSAIIMCTLIFQASETQEMTVGFAILSTVYFSMKLIQALMYAWYGTIVYTESEEFRDAVYSCGWCGSGDKSLMNNVLIMLNHKPLILTACKFLIVSTDMFTSIVNATMSYFFLLQTLDEDN